MQDPAARGARPQRRPERRRRGHSVGQQIGLPPPLFLQGHVPLPLVQARPAQPPAHAPRPLAPAAASASLHPGMRAAPSAPVGDAALRLGPPDAFEQVTQFRRAWGTPPPVPGVSWNAMRAIYKPDPGTQGRGGAQAAALERRAADDVYMQAYRSGEAGAPWRFRWVRVPTAIPTAGAPYTVLGEVEALDARPLAATQPAASLEDLQRRIQFNDTLTERAAQRASTFDITLYQFVGVRHTKGQVDRMVYHLEPRKDLPPQQQEELWEALCTSPDVPPQFRSSAEDCQVRRWFREANAKIK